MRCHASQEVLFKNYKGLKLQSPVLNSQLSRVDFQAYETAGDRLNDADKKPTKLSWAKKESI